jgi:hypothetical protein
MVLILNITKIFPAIVKSKNRMKEEDVKARRQAIVLNFSVFRLIKTISEFLTLKILQKLFLSNTHYF